MLKKIYICTGNPTLLTIKLKNMAFIRFEALKEVFSHSPKFVEAPSSKVSDYYGS